MAIPDFQSIMLPLLKYASDQNEHSLTETTEGLAQAFQLTEEEKKELLPSGQQAIFLNRVGWAKTYLTKANLLESTRRGIFKITELGIKVLKQSPSEINIKFLENFPGYIEFKNLKGTRVNSKQNSEEDYLSNLTVVNENITPEEAIEIGYQKIRQELEDELLQKIKESSPSFFEYLVVDVLVKMGYGGSKRDAGQAIGQSGDGGIDGIIKEDPLGLDIVYIQAKRWDNTTVGRPEIQKFVGALHGQRAKKGVFITTSNFSQDAREYVSNIDLKIVLINGKQLTQFMIDYNVGISTIRTYEIKKIDSDYFSED
ncbi:MAG: restriction endonuclease [Microcoleaceae cyanobacterium]